MSSNRRPSNADINTIRSVHLYGSKIDEICISLFCARDQQHISGNLRSAPDMKAIFLLYLRRALRLHYYTDFIKNKHTMLVGKMLINRFK